MATCPRPPSLLDTESEPDLLVPSLAFFPFCLQSASQFTELCQEHQRLTRLRGSRPGLSVHFIVEEEEAQLSDFGTLPCPLPQQLASRALWSPHHSQGKTGHWAKGSGELTSPYFSQCFLFGLLYILSSTMKCRMNAVVEKYLQSITMSFTDLTSTLGV